MRLGSVRIFHQPNGAAGAAFIARKLHDMAFDVSTLEKEKFPIAGSMAPTLRAVAEGFDVAIAVIAEGVDREVWIRGELATQSHMYQKWLIALGDGLRKAKGESEIAFHVGEEAWRYVLQSIIRQGKDPKKPGPPPRRPLPGPMRPFNPAALVRAAVHNQKPAKLVAALEQLTQATEENGTVLFCEPLDLQSPTAEWQFREHVSLIDEWGRMILLGVRIDGRIGTAEVVEMAVQRGTGSVSLGEPGAVVPTNPAMLGAYTEPTPLGAADDFLDPDDVVDDEPEAPAPPIASFGGVVTGADGWGSVHRDGHFGLHVSAQEASVGIPFVVCRMGPVRLAVFVNRELPPEATAFILAHRPQWLHVILFLTTAPGSVPGDALVVVNVGWPAGADPSVCAFAAACSAAAAGAFQFHPEAYLVHVRGHGTFEIVNRFDQSTRSWSGEITSYRPGPV